MYLNDFRADNMQFLQEVESLSESKGIIFNPVGKEYDEYVLRCIHLFNIPCISISRVTSSEEVHLFKQGDPRLSTKIAEYLSQLGISRVSYRKVDGEKI